MATCPSSNQAAGLELGPLNLHCRLKLTSTARSLSIMARSLTIMARSLTMVARSLTIMARSPTFNRACCLRRRRGGTCRRRWLGRIAMNSPLHFIRTWPPFPNRTNPQSNHPSNCESVRLSIPDVVPYGFMEAHSRAQLSMKLSVAWILQRTELPACYSDCLTSLLSPWHARTTK